MVNLLHFQALFFHNHQWLPSSFFDMMKGQKDRHDGPRVP